MNRIARTIARLSLQCAPEAFYPAYCRWLGRNVEHLGVSKGMICISFDNDYFEDNAAAEDLIPILDQYAITVTWAVIGRWVENYRHLHEKLLRAGHQLINHTWSHPDNAQLRPGDPRKFHRMSAEEVEEEIFRAHEYLLKTLGYRMTGFRLPHFVPHAAAEPVLVKLGYTHTSNEFALTSLSLGVPYVNKWGMAEIPLSPIPRRPERIFETYRLFRAPDGLYHGGRQFFDDFCAALEFTERNKLISCFYFDACDVVRLNDPPFEEYLNVLSRRNIDPVRLEDIASLVLSYNHKES